METNAGFAVPPEFVTVAGLAALWFALYQARQNWSAIRWHLTVFWYQLPLIGKVAQLARNTDPEGQWYRSERELCNEFATLLPRTSIADFEKSEDYLQKVHEPDRETTPWYGWAVIAALAVIEAFGFAYVVAGFTVPGGSEQVLRWTSWAFATLIAVLLVWLTKVTGHDLYANSLKREGRAWWREWVQAQPPGQGRSYSAKGKISLDNTRSDDAEPEWAQLANRLKGGTTERRFYIYFTVAMVLIIAASATYLRLSAWETGETAQSLGCAMMSDDFEPGAAPPPLTPAEQRCVDEKRRASQVAFGLLAMIFVAIQVIGSWIGRQWGFAGEKSEAAWRSQRGFSTHESFMEHQRREHQDCMNATQRLLGSLQTGLAGNDPNSPLSLRMGERTFQRFLKEQETARGAA